MNSTKIKWNDIITSKLKNGVTLDDLSKTYESGITLEPNVIAADVEGIDHQIQSLRPWINMAAINASTSSEMNTLILKSLNEGANGLSIQTTIDIDLKKVLENVLTEYLTIRIDLGSTTLDQADKIKSQLDPEQYPNIRWFSDHHADVWTISSEDKIKQTRQILPKLKDHNELWVTVGKNLLFEIAFLRALRLINDRKSISNYTIIAQYDVQGANELGDYDLIEKTYKVMSAILGCADIVITPFYGTESDRLALNIHNVLELESGFKDVLDPVGGAFYIEKLTQEILLKIEE